MLGAAVGGEVAPDDFIWEERGGFFSDALLGRRVLFLAVARTGTAGERRGQADLWRAWVRLTRAGRPISVRAARDLSATPLADERDLVARDAHVAFATNAGGAVQGVTVLDLGGDRASRSARSRFGRMTSDLGAWLETGTTRGLGRTEIGFEPPPSVVRFAFANGLLVLSLGPDGVPAALDLGSGAVNPGPANPFAIRARRLPLATPRVGELAPELVRTCLGQDAGNVARTLVDAGRTLLSPLRRLGRRPARPEPLQPMAERALAAQDDASPPAPLQAPDLGGGEGVWRAALWPFTPRPLGLTEGAPPAIVETFVHPNPAAPSTFVRLVAFDTRQIELGMEPGFRRPHPAASLHGWGMVPELERPRVVAAFTGGRPRESDARGTVVRGHVLSPPVAGAGSIVLGSDAMSLGPWPFGADVPPFVTSLWQTAAPAIIAAGVPVRAGLEPERQDRAALGRTGAGHLVYAFGRDMSAHTLAQALLMAGCDVAYELGTPDRRPAFAFVGFSAPDATPVGALLDPAMGISLADLVSASPDELFYALWRDPTPKLPLSEGLSWAPDAGRQPPPSWLPAVYTVTVTSEGAQVHLTSFAPRRFRWRIHSGSRELTARLGAPFASALADSDQPNAGVALGLGTGRLTRRRPPRGLATLGATGLAIRPDGGLLVADAAGLSVLRSEDARPLGPDADASELPLTAEDGHLRPEARELGGMRPRVALCVLPDGTVLAAATTFDSDDATTSVLLDRGCLRVVALDRGAHQPSFVHRAGTPTPPLPSYEVTTLSGVEVAAVGLALATP